MSARLAPFLQASAFAFRSFPLLFRLPLAFAPLGNKRHHHHHHHHANDQRITFLPAAFTTSGRIDAEFLRLLFYHAHRESEEFFRLTGQLAQPNQDYVFSKRAAFFNSLKNKG